MIGRGVVEFDRFRLDPAARLLVDLRTGDPVSLPPRVFDTLLCLVEQRGELVGKSDLMDRVWPGVTVEENSLTQNISQLRRALGDNGNDRRFIVTAPGKGYRFVGEIASVSAQREAVKPVARAAPDPERPAHRTSLAVLPFANLTGDASQDYLGECMAEEILDLLSSCTGLRLPARGSTSQMRERGFDAVETATRLGVDALLAGSIRSSAERLRISVQLVNGEDGYLLWSRSFDRAYSDILSVQREVAAAVVDALAENLNAVIAPANFHAETEQDVEAYHLVLKVKWLIGRTAKETIAQALSLCDAAIARSPGFARAYGAKSHCFALINAVADRPDPAQLEEAKNCGQRALELDPACLEAHAGLAMAHGLTGDLLTGEWHCEQLRRLRPGDPFAAMGMGMTVLPTMGYVRAGWDAISSVEAFIPFHNNAAPLLALAAVLVDENEAAERFCARTLELGIPPSTQPFAELRAMLHGRKGEWDKAAEAIIATLDPAQKVAVAGTIRLVYRAIGGFGSKADAIAALDAIRADAITNNDQLFRKRLTLWYTQLNDPDRAIAFLADVVQAMKNAGLGFSTWSFLWLSELRPLQQHPGFIPIAREMGMIEFWEAHGPPDGYLFDGKRLIPRND